MSVTLPIAYALLALTLGSEPAGPADSRLYGRVVTASGEVFEGFIRWDKNEGSWDDLLNGDKRVGARAGSGERERDRGFEILGLRISWPREFVEAHGRSAESGIRFGHVRSLTVLDDDRALLLLRSGEEIELSGGSTDIGDELRGIEVEDSRRGHVTLDWDDLDVVEFMSPPAGRVPSAMRLHGTLEDRVGNTYVGWISWDLDEILTTDLLDGEDQSGRSRKIPFGDIAAIERAGRGSARVLLASGEEVVLAGTNDVDGANRGIQISDPGLGQVELDWDAFRSLRFHPADAADPYQAFDGGHRLFGTVLTEAGERITGDIRWDDDEEWSWEILDGNYRGAVYDVEFGQVRHIRRDGSQGATVTLVDGRVLELQDRNDVDATNKGVYITPAGGETVLVEWEQFREVTLAAR